MIQKIFQQKKNKKTMGYQLIAIHKIGRMIKIPKLHAIKKSKLINQNLILYLDKSFGIMFDAGKGLI